MKRIVVLSVVVLGTCWAAAATQDSYLHSVVVELSRQWPQNRTVNIVCHGHSVPAGYFKTPVVDTFNAYFSGNRHVKGTHVGVELGPT